MRDRDIQFLLFGYGIPQVIFIFLSVRLLRSLRNPALSPPQQQELHDQVLMTIAMYFVAMLILVALIETVVYSKDFPSVQIFLYFFIGFNLSKDRGKYRI